MVLLMERIPKRYSLITALLFMYILSERVTKPIILLSIVKDNGIGIDEEKLKQLRYRLSQPSDTLDEAHIGIKNVHDRIQFHFGEHYGIEINSQIGEGTTVIIRLPAT